MPTSASVSTPNTPDTAPDQDQDQDQGASAPYLASQIAFYESRVPAILDLAEMIAKHRVRLDLVGATHTRVVLSIKDDQYTTLSIGTAPAGTISVSRRLGVRSNAVELAKDMRDDLVTKAANLSLDILTGRVSRGHLTKHFLKKGRFPVVCSRSLPGLNEVEAKIVTLRKDREKVLAAYFEEHSESLERAPLDWRQLSTEAKQARTVDELKQHIAVYSEQLAIKQQQRTLRLAMKAPLKLSMILAKNLPGVWDVFTSLEMEEKLKYADLRESCLIVDYEIEKGQPSRQAASIMRGLMCDQILNGLSLLHDEKAETVWRANPGLNGVTLAVIKKPDESFLAGKGAELSARSADKLEPKKLTTSSHQDENWEQPDPSQLDSWDDVPSSSMEEFKNRFGEEGSASGRTSEEEKKARRLAAIKADLESRGKFFDPLVYE